VNEYEIDREYEHLWFEIPLPKSVSKLLGGKSEVPVALFRNLGWLLSDDIRIEVRHSSSNPGQVTMRLFDWIAVAMYAKRGLGSDPLVFKLSVYQVGKTKDGVNPLIEMWPIGTAAEVIETIYERFGITLGKPEQVIARGYAVLKALREEAFKRNGKVYVVDDVGAWIAFSATVVTLVLGDGYILAFELGVATKSSPRTTLKGETTNDRELAKALGGTATRKGVHLKSWHMRLVLPAPPVPIFEKATRVYDAFMNYPATAIVEINGTTYLLTYRDNRQFVIGKVGAVELYETVKRFGLRMREEKHVFVLGYTQLRELAKHVQVRLLNELEKDVIREVRPATSPDLDALKRVLEEITKIARVDVVSCRNHKCVKIVSYNSKPEEIVKMLKATGIRAYIACLHRCILIEERKSVDAVCRVMSQLFSTP